MQGENALTYIHLVSVHARIRVRKLNSNIHSNRKVQVHSYHKKWYNITWISHHQRIQKYDLQRDVRNQKLRGAHEQQRVLRANQEKSWEERATVTSTDPCFCCATLIGYSKVTTDQALGSRHEGSGLSESNPTST